MRGYQHDFEHCTGDLRLNHGIGCSSPMQPFCIVYLLSTVNWLLVLYRQDDVRTVTGIMIDGLMGDQIARCPVLIQIISLFHTGLT